MTKSKIMTLVAGLMLGLMTMSGAFAAQVPVTLTAADGVKVYGTYYRTNKRTAPIILLFHQAGSNRYEYEPIVPRLSAAGFNVLAIDQRSGGTMWGHKNDTVKRLKKSSDYLAALPDLQAALDWADAVDPTRKTIVWGSSYSASLVFVLAANNPGKIAGLLAFSPGEYFADAHMVHDAAAKLTIPVFVASAADKTEIAAAQAILAAVATPDAKKVQYVPTEGVHGSKTLRDDSDAKGAAANWQAVLGFLGQFH